MKCFFALTGAFLVLGCNTKAPSVSVAETAKESISVLEQTLTPECKTEAVTTQLAVLKQLVNTQLLVCEAEKDNLKAAKEKSDMLATFLALIIFTYVGYKLFKKF